MKCPKCGTEINAAAELASLGKGKPKTFSAAELKLRAQRLAAARAKRWPKKKTGQ